MLPQIGAFPAPENPIAKDDSAWTDQ